MQSWTDVSEIVVGALIAGKLSINTVRPELFISPYDSVVKLLQTDPGKSDIGLLIEKCGLSTVQASTNAYKSLDDETKKANWVTILESAYARNDAGTRLEKAARRLQRGENIDWSKILEIGANMTDKKARFTPLSDITASEVPFMPTGWKPLDEHLSGIPEVGLIVVGGNPGVGKTSWAIKLAGKFARKYPEKRVAFFTLEMILAEFAARCLEIDKTITKEAKKRILICDEVMSVGDLVNQAALVPELGLICVDFADLLVPGEVTEPAMAVIYKTLAAASKRLKVPVVLLAQYNRNYGGGIPHPNNLRYTSLAEALAWMIILLYAPDRDFYSDNGSKAELPVVPNKAYMICWKCRGGFRVHNAPGAIQSGWLGESAWSDSPGKWFDLSKGKKEDNEDDEE